MVSRLLFSSLMPRSEPTLQLRPALRPPTRRRELAVAATVLLASASGGVLVALLQPPARPPAVLILPVPTAIGVPTYLPGAEMADDPQPPLLADVAPVVEHGGLRVVLASAVEPQWVGDGPIRVDDRSGVRALVRPLSAIGQARFGGVAGTAVRLFRADGASCTAEITGVVALGRFAPEDMGDGEPLVDAAAAWSVAAHVIAADLAPGEEKCEGAIWAQPERLEEPVRATIAAATAEQARQAGKLLRATSAYSEATDGSDPKLDVQAIALEGGETLLVASALLEGCADLQPVVTALYAVQADGSLHEVGGGFTVSAIEAAADFDGDGRVEILVRGDELDLAILRRRAGEYQVEAHAELPIYGCRC